MTVKDKTATQLTALAATRAASGVRYPVVSESIYPTLIQMIDQASQSAAYWLQAKLDDNAGDSTTHVAILAGRATIDGLALAFAGQTIDLAAYNNDVVYLWAAISGGAIVISTATDAIGWPATGHLKLAQVTLVGGDVTAILDRRAESMLVGGLPAMPIYPTSGRPAAATAGRYIFDSDLGKMIVDNGAAWVNADGSSL